MLAYFTCLHFWCLPALMLTIALDARFHTKFHTKPEKRTRSLLLAGTKRHGYCRVPALFGNGIPGSLSPGYAGGCGAGVRKRSSPQRPRSRTERRMSAFSTDWPCWRRREAKVMKLRALV